MLPKLENKTLHGIILYIVFTVVHTITIYIYNVFIIDRVLGIFDVLRGNTKFACKSNLTYYTFFTPLSHDLNPHFLNFGLKSISGFGLGVHQM